MKIRLGHVSNSSSSSFIVMSYGGISPIPQLHYAYAGNNHNDIHIPGIFGGTIDFTECRKYESFADKLNYLALMCWLKEGPQGYENTNLKWTNLLNQIIYSDFDGRNLRIDYMFEEDVIDDKDMRKVPEYSCSLHPQNDKKVKELFEDEKTLRSFLYLKNCYLELKWD